MDAGLFYVGLLALAVVISIGARRFHVPYTVALVVVGLGLGTLHPAAEPHLTRESLYLVFLPGLIYETALHLDLRTLLDNKKLVVMLAVLGVLVVASLTAVTLTGASRLLGTGALGWTEAILFGALISPTDPIAVVSLFKSLGAPKRLVMIVDGESLLNDGVAIVLFEMVLELSTGAPLTASRCALELFRVVTVALLAGTLVALVVVSISRAVGDAASRVALTTVAAYGSFLAAEYFHASGIVATVVAGLITTTPAVVGAAGSPVWHAVESCWDYAAFALNSLVFLLVGFQAVQLGDMVRLWLPIVVAYLVVTGSRALVVALVTRVLRRSRERVPGSWTKVLAWSGLRGALSMVLALDVPESVPGRKLVLTLTSGVVVLSILVQGLTMTRLLRRLGIVPDDASGTAVA
jgi:CPA1 family monovalent cation:H+ antiporter